jgi:hypothetical protein
MNIKDLVKNNTVEFVEYRKGNLWYITKAYSFLFPVPIEDVGDATFLAEDSAMLFIRYIRKHLDALNLKANAT